MNPQKKNEHWQDHNTVNFSLLASAALSLLNKETTAIAMTDCSYDVLHCLKSSMYWFLRCTHNQPVCKRTYCYLEKMLQNYIPTLPTGSRDPEHRATVIYVEIIIEMYIMHK